MGNIKAEMRVLNEPRLRKVIYLPNSSQFTVQDLGKVDTMTLLRQYTINITPKFLAFSVINLHSITQAAFYIILKQR